MPAVSEKQRKFMAICAHTPGKARGKCPSKAIAREFSFKSKKRKRRTVPKPDEHGYY